jgi:hypothetical protein
VATTDSNSAYDQSKINHCHECYDKYLVADAKSDEDSRKHDDLSVLVNAASDIVRSEYKPGDRPVSLDAADAFLKKVFQCATVSLGQAGLVVPDSFFLGGKSRG